MDLGDPAESDEAGDHDYNGDQPKPRLLPSDLPTSLNDRKAPRYLPDVATYDLDAWGEGHSQATFIPASIPFDLNLSLHDFDDPSPAPPFATSIEISRPTSRLTRSTEDSHGDRQDSLQDGNDFYHPSFTQDRLEEEMEDDLRRHRMMMESAMDREVDLGIAGVHETEESSQLEFDQDSPRFVWDRCLGSQMFHFDPSNLDKILEAGITDFRPARNEAQRPIPANLVFLAARFAHYRVSLSLLHRVLDSALVKIEAVVDKRQQDMAVLAFWLSNCTLLLYYLRRDPGLEANTSSLQLTIAEMVNDIAALIEKDGERRLERILTKAMLDFENNPRPDLKYQGEWSLFRSKPKTAVSEPIERQILPPSLDQQARVSPTNVQRELESIANVLSIFDVHVAMKVQILAQLLYWINARLFNSIISAREYRSRHKATQIRFNIWQLEEYFRRQSQTSDRRDLGIFVNMRDIMVQTFKKQLAPTIQLLQWLQALSAQQDIESLTDLMSKVHLLSTQQLTHTAKGYRAESVGERMPPKKVLRQIDSLRTADEQKRKSIVSTASPVKEDKLEPDTNETRPSTDQPSTPIDPVSDELHTPTGLMLQEDFLLPFSLPTTAELINSYGIGNGHGRVERGRAAKFSPEVPDAFWEHLESLGLTQTVSQGEVVTTDGEHEGATETEAEAQPNWDGGA